MARTLYVITGPTAVGKTVLALRWAETRPYPVAIVSCDSLLVYRGMDIGTAKPTRAERERVPHYGINLVEATQPFNVVDYVGYARGIVDRLHAEGVTPLITGGSGFYLKSFFSPVLDPVDIPDSVTRAVRNLYRERGLAAMVARLKSLNPGGVGDLDLQNPRRVMRALERCLASGKPLPELQRIFREQPAPYPDFVKRVCLLQRGTDSLWERIERRTKAMLDQGLIEEVRALREVGFECNPSASGSIGYRETLDWLDSGSPGRELLEQKINLNTRKLLKKQRSWFRHQIPVDQALDLDSEEAEDRTDLESLFPGD